MSDTTDLISGFQFLSKNLDELAVRRALTGANEKVEEVKASESSAEAKRAALFQISQGLTAQLNQFGADPARMATAIQSIFPTFKTPQEAAMVGSLTGNQDMVKAAREGDLAAQAGNIAQTKITTDNQLAMTRLKIASDEKLAQMAGGNSPGKQNQANVEFDTNANYVFTQAKALKELIGRRGNWEIADEDAASKLEQSKLDFAIAYAKIVDPASVAREGEVAAAQKYIIQMGPLTRNSRTIADINNMVTKVRERQKERTKAIYSSQTASAPPSNDAGVPDDMVQFLNRSNSSRK